MIKPFDAIVIGAGRAGRATKLAGNGLSVVVVERKLVGGTCVNVGCSPTKAMVASAHAAFVARRAADFGVVASTSVKIDLAKILERSPLPTGVDAAHTSTRADSSAPFRSARRAL